MVNTLLVASRRWAGLLMDTRYSAVSSIEAGVVHEYVRVFGTKYPYTPLQYLTWVGGDGGEVWAGQRDTKQAFASS